jgi:hypothetical protein
MNNLEKLREKLVKDMEPVLKSADRALSAAEALVANAEDRKPGKLLVTMQLKSGQQVIRPDYLIPVFQSDFEALQKSVKSCRQVQRRHIKQLRKQLVKVSKKVQRLRKR